MKRNNRFITRTALIAAVYAALTYAFAWMSYEQIQFRISEVLVLFAFIEPRYGLGLVLGCILANLASPFGVIDIAVGSFATFLAIVFIVKIRKLFGLNKKALIIASLGPVITNALLVGAELTYLFNSLFIECIICWSRRVCGSCFHRHCRCKFNNEKQCPGWKTFILNEDSFFIRCLGKLRKYGGKKLEIYKLTLLRWTI